MCSDIHDKIYAFVGMASDRLDGDFSINYDDSLVDVYHRYLSFYDRLRTNQLEAHVEIAYLAAVARCVLGRGVLSQHVDIVRESYTRSALVMLFGIDIPTGPL